MTDPTITCPQCKKEIKLTESLAGPLLIKAKDDFDNQLVEARLEIRREEAAGEKEKAATLRKSTDKALSTQAEELSLLKSTLIFNEEKLTKAQQEQAEAIKAKRKLADDRRELELTIERRVSEGLSEAGEQALEVAEHRLRAKVDEREQTINSMKIEIENLTRKAEQISQRPHPTWL